MQLQQLPNKYLATIENKVDKYSNRLNNKTEKTLEKLSRWENKIKSLLDKTSPETAQTLFAPGQTTFTIVLQKYKEGKSISEVYKASYNQYRDQLTTQLKYLEEKKASLNARYIKPLAEGKKKIQELEENIENTEALQQFITERKKQLVQEALHHLGKSKYLQKINKEAFYYTETLRNYKEIFNDSKKMEESALALLNKIPAFKKFMRENSMLASLFGIPDNYGSAQSLAGLQTRTSVNAGIQTRIAAGGPNAMAAVQQNMQQAQAELTKLKDKILKAGGASSSDGELPDFKPNMQKTKTFSQRLEYGMNIQPEKNNSLLPGALNVGLSVGYKLNDKSLVGLGLNYKLGMGKIDKINFTHEGIGFRSFMDWKIKKQFFISGGYEMNFLARAITASQILPLGGEGASWQQSALLGISKKLSLRTKFIKSGQLQLLYDFLYKQHEPVSKQWVFRMGYKF